MVNVRNSQLVYVCNSLLVKVSLPLQIMTGHLVKDNKFYICQF